MITKQSDIIDKTFGYLLRGEIWLDKLASKNKWYKSSSQRDPLSLSPPPARHQRPSLPAHPCPSLPIPTLYHTHSLSSLHLPRPLLFIPLPAGLALVMVLADLKRRYGHLNTTYGHRLAKTTAIAACIVTWQSSGPEVIAAFLASDSRPSPAVPWPTAIAFGPTTGHHPALTRRPHPPRTRDRLRGSLW